MYKRIGMVALFLAVVAGAVLAKKEETLEQLAARADSAHVDQQPSLCMEVAERALKVGTDAYTANTATKPTRRRLHRKSMSKVRRSKFVKFLSTCGI